MKNDNDYDEKDNRIPELSGKLKSMEEENRQLKSDLQISNAKIQWCVEMMESLTALYKPLISSGFIGEIANVILDQAQKLTTSQHGYVSSIDPITGDSISHTLTNMMENSCDVNENLRGIIFRKGEDGLFPGLSGHSLNSAQAFFTNAPHTHPSSKGVPEGHILIKRFLSVPVMLDDKVVGQIALANSDRDYTENDLFSIKRLAEYYALAIQRQRTENKLTESEIRYQNVIAQADGVAYQRNWETNSYVFTDEGIEKITGYSSEEITPEIFDSLIIEQTDYTKRSMPVQSDITRKVGGERATAYKADYRLLTRNGQEKWVTDSSIQIRDESGKLIDTLGIILDITNRIQAEEDIRLLGQLLDLAPASITVHDPEGNFLYANQETYKSHGYTKDEFLELRVNEIDVPESTQLYEGRLDLLRKNSEVFFNVSHYKKDGSVIPMDIHARLIDWKGKMVVMSIGTDIAERLQSENALRESEERYRSIVETSKEGIWAVDHEFRITFTNQAMADMLGYETSEVMGRMAIDFMFTEDIEGYRKRREERIKGIDGQYEGHFRRRDGKECWTIISSKALIDEDGKFAGSFAMFTDITERKNAEHILQAKEQEFRTLVENVPGAVYRCEVHSPWRVLYMSDGIQVITGRLASEFVSGAIHFGNIVHPDDMAELDRIINEGIMQKHHYDLEYRVLHTDGSIRWASERGRATYNADGDPIYLDGVIIDITDRKQTEEIQARLQQASKLESIGRLAGGVAHDFNNLLTVIQGSISLAMIGLSQNDPLNNRLKMIEDASDRAAQLTRQLLAFSRKQIIEPKVINLNTLVENLRKMMTRIIGEDIELVISLQEDLHNINADVGQIEQVIVNLAVNSRDAMPNGGKLFIETENVIADQEFCKKHPTIQTGHYVLLSVSDTGHGMDEETKNQIYEPFFTTKKQGIGTGLGLATVYGIVKQHDGFINCYSEIGQGTVFKIYLPIIDLEDSKSDSELRTSEELSGNEVILFVEDEEIVREVAIEYLERMGYKILSAENGGMALLISEQHEEPIDLLITDVVMPGMDGKQLVERLHLARPEMKILYTSGYTNNVIVHHGILDEGLNFISKPYRLQALAKTIRDILDKH